MHSDRTPASNFRRIGRTAVNLAKISLATLAITACGNNYRPVVSSINPVGPAGQPTKYAIAISSTGASTQGLVTLVDFSGDTVVNTTLIGVNPYYFNLASTGFEGYTLNSDGTLTSFSVSTSLLASEVLQSTLYPSSTPVSIYSQGSALYIAEAGRNAVADLTGLPPAIQEELPTGAGTIYTVGATGATRAYALAQGSSATANGTAVPIEVSSSTTDSPIAVGSQPVYGVMTADLRRAFVLNHGSNTVTVINAQSNALDSFPIAGANVSTIPVGTGPIWADFAPTLSEMLVVNEGTNQSNGTTPGTVSVINIPLCNAATVTSNPNCDTNNPVDAVGFGQVIATIPVGINPIMIAVMQDGSEAFVANAGVISNGTAGSVSIPGSVSVINLSTNTVVATIPAAISINESDAIVHGHPNYIAVTTGTPTGKAYVTASDSTDITILRTDNNTVQTHLPLQGYGVSVRVNTP